jgi:hypothetical protein
MSNHSEYSQTFEAHGHPFKRECVPVLYRMDNPPGPRAQVTAIFPEMSEDAGRFTCYAHIGQHGIASREWICESTRPATPAEYADLHAELSQIYTGDCVLVIRKRFPSWRQLKRMQQS